ncbi:hypothetical protein BJX66DRAFT_339467 [Aspergillus keveii]|uniref:Ankyrin repeat-containing protein n=1 Tax=Aspergillus keveii TaxID=714993 RepID=A0ABR4G1D6_9EURO
MALCSRDEFHIRKALRTDFAHIDIMAQTVDVRRYVREEIEERIQRTALMLRSPALKEDIINTLISKAGGITGRFVVYLSPLAFCHSLQCIRYLERHGYSLGDVDDDGFPALHGLLSTIRLRRFNLQADLLGEHGLDRTCVNLERPSVAEVDAIIRRIPRFLRALGADRVLGMFPSEPQTGFSALCMAGRLGDVPACRALVSIGANIDFEAHPDGNPLDLGIIFNRLEVVEYLVRAGASIVYYSTREGRYKSAFGSVHWYPKTYQEIYRWMLVERYTEQRRICS